MRHRPTASTAIAFVALLAGCALFAGCISDGKPQRRTRASSHDAECRDKGRAQAFMYPATNREFGPDDPNVDGCILAVPDHLFCCPDAPKPTDR